MHTLPLVNVLSNCQPVLSELNSHIFFFWSAEWTGRPYCVDEDIRSPQISKALWCDWRRPACRWDHKYFRRKQLQHLHFWWKEEHSPVDCVLARRQERLPWTRLYCHWFVEHHHIDSLCSDPCEVPKVNNKLTSSASLLVIFHKNQTHGLCAFTCERTEPPAHPFFFFKKAWCIFGVVFKLCNSSLVFDELAGRKVTPIAYPGTGKTAIAKGPACIYHLCGRLCVPTWISITHLYLKHVRHCAARLIPDDEKKLRTPCPSEILVPIPTHALGIKVNTGSFLLLLFQNAHGNLKMKLWWKLWNPPIRCGSAQRNSGGCCD